MKPSIQIYAVLSTIFIVSLGLSIWWPQGAFQQFASLPMVIALLGGVLQIYRDDASRNREIVMQQLRNRYSLGASSHMANVAFDHHVEFAENYVAEVQETLINLYREGPTERALTHSNELYNIRRKYALWLTADMNLELEKFESALRKLGATVGYLKAQENGKDRKKIVEKMYREFSELIGPESFPDGIWNGEKLNEEKALPTIIKHLQIILGIDELTKLRRSLIANAIVA